MFLPKCHEALIALGSVDNYRTKHELKALSATPSCTMAWWYWRTRECRAFVLVVSASVPKVSNGLSGQSYLSPLAFKEIGTFVG